MLKKTLTLAIVLMGAALPAWGQATLESLELGIETSTLLVRVPDALPTRWTFVACEKCPAMTVDVDANSAFFVGHEQVSLAVLRKYAARGSNEIDLYVDRKTLRLNRAILRTELDAADRTRATVPARH